MRSSSGRRDQIETHRSPTRAFGRGSECTAACVALKSNVLRGDGRVLEVPCPDAHGCIVLLAGPIHRPVPGHIETVRDTPSYADPSRESRLHFRHPRCSSGRPRMPTLSHEAPLFLLRGRPALIAELLSTALCVTVPPFVESSAEEADLTQLTPTE